MRELIHPVELRDEQLDLVAAGTGGGGGGHHGGHGCGCGGGGGLVNVETGDINVLSGNNIAVLSLAKQFAFV